jgi:ABC-type amino acid transport substrate-binding protein
MYFTESRAESFLFSAPILPVRTVLIGRKGAVPTSYDSLDELDGFTFSVLRDNALSPAFDAADLRRVSTSYQRNQVQAVMKGTRTIAAVSSEAVFLDTALRLGYPRTAFQVLEPPLKTNETHLAVPRVLPNARALVEAFNAGLESIRRSGRFDAILREFDFEAYRR